MREHRHLLRRITSSGLINQATEHNLFILTTTVHSSRRFTFANMSSKTEIQPRASLSTLPQELQDTIVHLIVDGYQRGQGLLELSYTCRRLRATCLPIIYENIKLYGYFDKSCMRLYRPERTLARTVSTSPAHVGQHIKKLELNGVEVRDDIAEQMLPHMVNLKTLIYKFEIQCNRDGLGTWPDTQTLGRALVTVAQSLEHLEITYQHQGDEPRGSGPIFPHGTVLSTQLVALRSLLIPMSLLLGWRTDSNPHIADVLPTSLVQLNIHHDLDRPRDHTFVQHASWKQTTPCLESITVHDMVWGTISSFQDRDRATAKHLVEQNGLLYYASRRDIYQLPDSDDDDLCTWAIYD
jgi:hypothetical protein